MPAKPKKPTPRQKSHSAPSVKAKSASKTNKPSKPVVAVARKSVGKSAPAKVAPKAKLVSKPVKSAKPIKLAKVAKSGKIVEPSSKKTVKVVAKTAVKVSAKVSAKAPVGKAAKKPVKPIKVVKASKPIPKPTPKAKAVKVVAKPKPATKPVAKLAPKPAAVPAKAKVIQKPSSGKASKTAPIAILKPAKPSSAAAVGKQDKKIPASKPAAPVKAVAKAPVAPKEIAIKAVAEKPAKVVAETKSKAGKVEYFKGTFFQEVAPGSPAVRKSRAPQTPPVSFKKPKGEESHDELIARIERELLTVRMTSRKVQKPQVCTKCCINPVDPSYMVDRDTGYCGECAVVLGLGHTREARQQNFHPSLMKSEEEEVFEE